MVSRATTSPLTPRPIPSRHISHAVWLYARFTLSLRDVEDLFAQRETRHDRISYFRFCSPSFLGCLRAIPLFFCSLPIPIRKWR